MRTLVLLAWSFQVFTDSGVLIGAFSYPTRMQCEIGRVQDVQRTDPRETPNVSPYCVEGDGLDDGAYPRRTPAPARPDVVPTR